MRLQNKVAILTGCGSGIGEAVSHRFAMEGAKCILADINGEHAKKVAFGHLAPALAARARRRSRVEGAVGARTDTDEQ